MEVQRIWIRHLELISESLVKMNATVRQTKHQPAREPVCDRDQDQLLTERV